MSDSNQASLLKSPLLSSYVAQVTAAQTELDKACAIANTLAGKLIQPTGIELRGYCADAFLRFDLEADAAGHLLDPESSYQHTLAVLKSYPPVPLVDLVGLRAVKPLSTLRGHELEEDAVPCFPVVVKTHVERNLHRVDQTKAVARWWTELDGKLAEVQAKAPALGVLERLYGTAHEASSDGHPTGGQTSFHRVLKPYDVECLDVGLLKVHADWTEFLQKNFHNKPGAIQWARALYAFAYVNGVPDSSRLLNPHMPFNRGSLANASSISEAAKQEILAAVANRIAREKEVEPQVRELLANRLNQAKDLLTSVLSSFNALRGCQNFNSPSPRVAAVLQQKLDEKGIGARLGLIRESMGGFDVRVQIASPAVKDGLAFMDFSIKGNPEGQFVRASLLNPEYLDTTYPWEA